MKSFILSFCLLFSVALIAQNGTSLEEYRYLSKGYVYQLEMGLDANKEGYNVQELFTASNHANLVGLYQKGQTKPRALLVILNHDKNEATYICVPNAMANDRVKELAESDHGNLDPTVKQQYQNALNEFLFAALTSPETEAPLAEKPVVPINYNTEEELVSRSAELEEHLAKKSPEFEYSKEPIFSVESAPVPISNHASKKSSTRTVNGMLTTRTILSEEEALTTSNAKGVVAVKICVDSDGKVKTAKFTQRGSTTFNSSLKKAAIKAAKSIKFAKLDIPEQCGIINYKF